MNFDICKQKCGVTDVHVCFDYNAHPESRWLMTLYDEEPNTICIIRIPYEKKGKSDFLNKSCTHFDVDKKEKYNGLVHAIDMIKETLYYMNGSCYEHCPYAVEHAIFDWNKEHEY